MKKNKLLYYINHKNLIGEIEHYGYVYSLKKLILTYIATLVTGLLLAYLFRLHITGYIVIVLFLILITPKLVIQAYRTMYEQRKFSDASKYIEKMLYYFKAHNKIITALSDASEIFPEGEMKDVINKAIDYIYNQDEDALEAEEYNYLKNYKPITIKPIEEKALKLIELKFPTKRINRLHKFFLQVEQNGGNPDLGIELLLNDREDWVNKIVNEQKDKAYARKIFVILSLCLMVIALAILYYPLKNSSLNFDLSSNFIVRAASTLTIILTMVLYVKFNKIIEKSWFNDDISKYATAEYYYKITNYDMKKSKRNSLIYALATLVITICLYAITKSYVIIIMGLLITIFMYSSAEIGYNVGKKQLTSDISSAFTDWIIEVALLMQFNNVVTSIADSYDNTPEVLKPEVEKMLISLGDTPTSSVPFNDFCIFFNLQNINDTMDTLYSVMSASGSDVHKELHNIFKQTRIQTKTINEQKRSNKDAVNKLYINYEILIVCGLLLIDMIFYFYGFIGNLLSII